MKKRSRQDMPKQRLDDWDRLLSAQMIFQAHFPECILVGGTAASLHAKHRISTDADYVLPDLRRRFAQILEKVEAEAGWTTRRIEPPVLILGHFQGVRTGIRQLIRAKPLETTLLHGLRIPTLEEMLRIKAVLIVRRNATRDFIDFVALMDHLGMQRSLEALDSLDALYPQKEEAAVSRQLALQLAEAKPWDLSQTDLGMYKSLKSPYADWKEIQHRAAAAAQKLMVRKLKK